MQEKSDQEQSVFWLLVTILICVSLILIMVGWLFYCYFDGRLATGSDQEITLTLVGEIAKKQGILTNVQADSFGIESIENLAEIKTHRGPAAAAMAVAEGTTYA